MAMLAESGVFVRRDDADVFVKSGTVWVYKLILKISWILAYNPYNCPNLFSASASLSAPETGFESKTIMYL